MFLALVVISQTTQAALESFPMDNLLATIDLHNRKNFIVSKHETVLRTCAGIQSNRYSPLGGDGGLGCHENMMLNILIDREASYFHAKTSHPLRSTFQYIC